MELMTIFKMVIVVMITGAIALQFKSFSEWLVWGVTEAEIYLGSGTGELKLKYVYDLAIAKFPIFVKFITFDLFKKLVDIALDKMREMIETNEDINNIVLGSGKNE